MNCFTALMGKTMSTHIKQTYIIAFCRALLKRMHRPGGYTLSYNKMSGQRSLTMTLLLEEALVQSFQAFHIPASTLCMMQSYHSE